MSNDKKIIQRIANERIDILIGNAKKLFEEDLQTNNEIARKYVHSAYLIKRHYRIRRHIKDTCNKCFNILIPGKTCNIVVASSKHFIIYKCMNCGSETKFHYR